MTLKHMTSINIETVTREILHNCRISDSRHAGLYSVCGLALRLRDLYKWEHGLNPWEEKDPSEVLGWIGDTENVWETLEGTDYAAIRISGRPYDPFDVDGINKALIPCGFYYGAGYMHSMKPSFFLAEIEAQRRLDGYGVYFLGRELARDLTTAPAMSHNGTILVRQESVRSFLWDKIFFINKSGKTALRFALASYGLKDDSPKTLRENLFRIASDEVDTYIYHELGELKDKIFDRCMWQEMISMFPHTPVELLLRGVKDLLADTNTWGRLRYIVRERRTASLGLYVAFYDGFLKLLFPELKEAFREFLKSPDWTVIEQAVTTGCATAKRYVEDIYRIYIAGKQRNDMEWVAAEIENRLLVPLGVGA
jgi:hypothetical protein